MFLGRNWRLQVFNETGVAIAANGVIINGRLWKFNAGALAYEASETEYFNNSGSIADDAYDESTAVDNSSNLYMGGDFEITIVTTGSPAGTVSVYLQKSTDGGTSFGDDGSGRCVYAKYISASGTVVSQFSI